MLYRLNQTKIAELIEAGEVKPLDSDLEIEDCITAVSDLDRKIDFLKRLKKNRQETIDKVIKKHESTKNLIRQVILETLKVNEIKSLDFPGVGRVVSKNTKGKWIIDDEETLISILEKELDKDQLEETVKSSKSLVKKHLNKILERWSKTDSVPKCVKKEDDQVGLSVSIYEPEKLPEANANSATDTEDLDKLDF